MPEKSAVGTDSLRLETKPAPASQRLRVAVVGCGGIAQTHLAILKEFPDVEVVAGVDVDPVRLHVMQERWGVTQLYSDWKTMLKEVRPDAVNICTPNGVHMQPALDASAAGCHVIVEKPMAMNPKECQRMIDAAQKAGKHLVVGFQFRFHPATEYLLRARDEGQFGNVQFVKCQALRRRGIPNWGVFGRKELQGGGPMIDIGVHVIEMAHYLMGSPKPVAASGQTWTTLGNRPSEVVCRWPGWDHKTYDVEDLAIGQVRFENGALMQIEASFAAHVKQDVWNFTLVGERGGCSWDPPEIFTDRAGTMVNVSPNFLPPDTGFEALFRLKLRNFVDACLHNAPTRAPGEAGLAVQKILDSIYRSAEAGKEVKID